MLVLLRWGTEWLSLKRRWIERGLIVGYGVLMCVGDFFDWHYAPAHHRFELFFELLMYSVYAMICTVMWSAQKMPEAHRFRRLLGVEWIYGRVWTVILTVLMGVLLVTVPPHRWSDMFFPLGMSCYAAFNYAISLPEDGERGKKRKLALAKLKQMFGTSWIVAPIPQPQ